MADDTLDIPVPNEDGGKESVEVDVTVNFGTHAMNQLLQSGNVAQNNFITVAKAQDYDYLEGKRVMDLVEAVGAREVQSEYNPGGPKRSGTATA